MEIVVDETLQRRWGPQITKRSHYRDPLLSGKGLSVSNSGLRWIIFALVVRVPWTQHHGASFPKGHPLMQIADEFGLL
jgi:hypothetical protein